MAMTLADFRTYVRAQTKDNATTPVFATNTIIDFWVNEAVKKFNSLTRSVNTSNIGSEVTTVADQRLYEYPTTVQDMYEVQYRGKRLLPVQRDRLPDYYGSGWQAEKGEPSCWYQEDVAGAAYFGLYPICGTAGYNIVCFGTYKPTAMSDAAHTTGLDERLDFVILNWVCEQIMISRHDFQKAREFRDQWGPSLAEYQSLQMNKRVRGSRQFLDLSY